MTVVPEQATQTKLSITECWRKRAEPAFALLAERKLDSTLECQFTKTGVSDNVGGVKHFSRTLQRALGEERHFALVDGFAFSNPGSLVISQVGNSVRPMHLFGRQRRVQVPISSGVVSKDSLTFSGQNQFQMASIEMTFHGEVSDTALSGTADMTSRSMILGPAMETATLSLIKQ